MVFAVPNDAVEAFTPWTRRDVVLVDGRDGRRRRHDGRGAHGIPASELNALRLIGSPQPRTVVPVTRVVGVGSASLCPLGSRGWGGRAIAVRVRRAWSGVARNADRHCVERRVACEIRTPDSPR